MWAGGSRTRKPGRAGKRRQRVTKKQIPGEQEDGTSHLRGDRGCASGAFLGTWSLKESFKKSDHEVYFSLG